MSQDYLVLTGPRALYIVLLTINIHLYYFDRAFEIKDGFSRTDSTYREINVNTIDKDVVYHDLYKNFGFLVEANVNRKPLINMQKEFNKKYYSGSTKEIALRKGVN